MKTPVLIAVTVLALTPLYGEEGLKDQTKPQVAASDGTMLTEAWRRGQTEVRLAELASTQAGSPAVKQLGGQMLTEHSRINEEIKAIARQKALNIWGDPDNIRISQLRQLNGDAFDRAYLTEVVRLHEKTIADFEEGLKGTSDPDVKAFLGKNLPVLRSHLAAVKKLNTGEAVAPVKTSTGL
jgi:putative membrane protein